VPRMNKRPREASRRPNFTSISGILRYGQPATWVLACSSMNKGISCEPYEELHVLVSDATAVDARHGYRFALC
jgi:hypothetical protein